MTAVSWVHSWCEWPILTPNDRADTAKGFQARYARLANLRERRLAKIWCAFDTRHLIAVARRIRSGGNRLVDRAWLGCPASKERGSDNYGDDRCQAQA
jgi:hypothetical protein